VVDAVVHRAKTSGVALVMVAGEVVLRDGRFTRVDKEAALRELAATLALPPTIEDEDRKRLSREVFPVVQRFYDGWLDENTRTPFYRPSSRT
jgi:5-methylthioadenosine/S-adenosylhomocysteine deaminase